MPLEKYKPDFERVRKYFKCFWEKQVLDRPLLAVTAPKNKKSVPVPYLAGAQDGNYTQAFEKFRVYAENTYFAGEALPAFDCSFGPDQYAAFFGGQISYAEESTSWVAPFLTQIDEYDLRPDTSAQSVFSRLMAFIRAAAEYSGGDFLVNMLDLHGNIDALSTARGPQNFLLDLYDDPDSVLRQTRNILDFYDPLVNAAAEAGKMYERGFIGWAPTFSEEKFGVVQCDVSCMMSPEMVRSFALPAIEYEVDHLKHCVYHYDGKEALGHLDDILAIKGIDVIQWVPGSGNPRSIEWMDLLKRIQKAGKGLWIYDWSVEEIKQHFKELKPEGLIFQVGAQDAEEADGLIEYVKKNM